MKNNYVFELHDYTSSVHLGIYTITILSIQYNILYIFNQIQPKKCELISYELCKYHEYYKFCRTQNTSPTL